MDVINDVQIVNCKSSDVYEGEYRDATILCTLSGATRPYSSSLQVGSVVDVEISSVDYLCGKIIAIK